MGTINVIASLRTRILLPFAVAVVMFGGLILLRSNLRQTEDAQRAWARHGVDVLTARAHVLLLAVEAESARRGGLADGYAENVRLFRGEAGTLRTLVSDNPTQVERVRRMEALFTAWTDHADPDALGELRRTAASFEATEAQLLEQRRAARLTTEGLREVLVVAGAAIALLMSGLVGFLLFRRVVLMARELTQASRDVGAGDFSRRVPTGAADELGQVARAFNQLVAKMEHRRAEIRKVNSMRELLHACNTAADVHATLEAFGPALLGPGALYLARSSGLVVAARWADGHAEKIETAACWAMRTGRAHSGACAHNGPSLCVPLDGEGLLVLAPAPDDGQLAGEIAAMTSMTLANLKLRDALRESAIRDELTGLYNRRFFEETLTRELGRGRRVGKPLSLLVIDVDHFKRFNDTYGHAAGDAVLRELGSLLRATFRSTDVVCRFGGEELVAVLPECSTEDAYVRAERLREAVSRLEPMHDGRPLGRISVSIGVATGLGVSATTLFEQADRAVYASKASGRDRVTVAPSIAAA